MVLHPFTLTRHAGTLLVLLVLVTGCSNGPDRIVGAECTTDEDCAERCLTGVAEGFCTVECTEHTDCPSGTTCADFDSEEVWVCLDN